MRTTSLISRLTAALLAGSLVLLAGPGHPATAAPAATAKDSARLAATTVSAGSAHGEYPASNVNDGNQATYWESANNAFPQWIQADLGSSVATDEVVLKLPAGWEARTQTLTVQGGTNGTAFSDLAPSKGYVFTPAGGNTVTIDIAATTIRYVRLTITANTGWPAGQLSEFEVYGPTSGDTQAPSAPSNLSFTEPGTGRIRLAWNASSDDVGVTGYDVYANNTLRTSVAGNVLTYTDTQPGTAAVTYFVRAKDAAGNQSPNSNTVTRNGPGGTNLAVGKPITASSSVFAFVATNANDDNTATYWEGAGGAYPNTLTVGLGANAAVDSVVLKLNPDSAWGTRTQNIQVLGREQSASGFSSVVSATNYAFTPSSSNIVTIPVGGAALADVQLRITSNTGAPAGQVAEFQVVGVPAPNPDLTITGASWSPNAPVETDAVTLSAVVRNAGAVASGPTNVTYYLGTAKAGTATVGALAAGASATVSVNAGPRTAGSYPLSAKVDEGNVVLEFDETNNGFAGSSPLVVTPVASSDLVASVGWTPNNPANGNPVTFSVAIGNQGTVASAGGAHGITLQVVDSATGAVVRTLTGSSTGAIAAGATTAPVNLGTWTAANGKYTVRVVLADDANELPVKQPNNTSEQPFFVGRGANMPYDVLEAEDAAVGGGAAVVGPNRRIGDLAGEASGRRAVTLNSTGSYVEFTTRASTNTLVTRFSIPDSSGGGGINATIDVYVNGTFHKVLPLTSRYAWLYGPEAGPGNSPGGEARHIYDEASIMLNSSYPPGTKIKLQKDAANTTDYAIDFVNTEQVAPIANPDPAKYAVPTGFGHQDVQNALDRVRMDTTGTLVGVYLPAGDYQTASKFQVYGKAVKVVGAGPWYTRFLAPSTQDNTDVGFRAEGTANGSTFANFTYLGNYTSRIDGPGKVFDFANVANMVIDNIWVEHMICLYWGANTDHVTIKNSRIRDLFADGVNMTNGSTDNHVVNNDARATGDDAFALFSAIDAGGADMKDNLYENLSTTLTWRAAGVAVYGGYANTFRNIYIADTLVYSGITISSLDFGYPMNGFGADPPTRFENISIVRAGGHFWNGQTFPGIWVFSASKVFQGIRVSDVDIVDPTYHGIMFQTNYVGRTAQFPVKDTVFTNVSVSGARKSGDAFDARSGFGIWANESAEQDQGPAVGSVTFNNLRLSGNAQDIKNTTSTFTIIRN
jgi:alpha-1,3-glucanase-like protein/CARDB protein/F5/8 type C domain-containing protein